MKKFLSPSLAACSILLASLAQADDIISMADYLKVDDAELRNIKGTANELKELVRVTEEGSAEEQYQLGRRYGNGDGVPVNIKVAYHLFMGAAQEGHVEALTNAAICLLGGVKGTQVSIARGLEYLHNAAEAGSTKAQSVLAVMYLDGQGVDKDEKRAMELFQQVADAGDTSGKVGLALCHILGMGTEVNEALGLKLMQEAASEGDSDAALHLASFYMEGTHGMPKDDEACFRNLKQAAEGNNERAYGQLAACYQYGIGTHTNEKQAQYWQQKADEPRKQISIGVTVDSDDGLNAAIDDFDSIYEKPADRYTPDTHQISARSITPEQARDIFGKLNQALPEYRYITINKIRTKPVVGGGNYHCLQNPKTKEIIQRFRSK